VTACCWLQEYSYVRDLEFITYKKIFDQPITKLFINLCYSYCIISEANANNTTGIEDRMFLGMQDFDFAQI